MNAILDVEFDERGIYRFRIQVNGEEPSEWSPFSHHFQAGWAPEPRVHTQGHTFSVKLSKVSIFDQKTKELTPT